MRVLVTASRTWTDRKEMARELIMWFSAGNVLVSGHARGGDRMAEELWAGWLDMTVERAIKSGHIEIHRPDWSRGRRAGHIRNAEMVKSGAGVCLAFACRCREEGCRREGWHATHGTSGCAERAETAEIKTIWTYDD